MLGCYTNFGKNVAPGQMVPRSELRRLEEQSEALKDLSSNTEIYRKRQLFRGLEFIAPGGGDQGA